MASTNRVDAEHTAPQSAASSSTPWSFYVPFAEAPSSSSPGAPSQVPLHQDDVEGQAPAKNATISPSDDNASKTYQTSFAQKWQTFWALSLPYFRESGEGRCLFAGLIVLMLLDSGVRVAFSYLARAIWSALGDRDADIGD